MTEGGPESEAVKETEVGAEFRVCPNCGYENGFHNMFRPSAEEKVFDWFFICPGCSSQWDVGLRVTTD
ncbi:MAG: hypothetical protein ACYS1C_06290 [Planctomycetota bacterium]|jgi:hypothetical protein